LQRIIKLIKKALIPVLIIFLIVLFFSIILKEYENKIYDFKVRLFLEKIESQIVFIDIDQKSINFYNDEFQIPWPWPRSFYAKAIDFFNKSGAKAVFIDLIFSEESIYGEEEDSKLAISMKNFKNVFLPFYFNENKSKKKHKNIFIKTKIPDFISPPIRTGILPPIKTLHSFCKGSGFVSQTQENDGIIRT